MPSQQPLSLIETIETQIRLSGYPSETIDQYLLGVTNKPLQKKDLFMAKTTYFRKTNYSATNDIFEEMESNVQSYARSFSQTFDKACGAKIWSTNGNYYLDFLAGAGSLNYGHNNPALKQALISYITRDRICHSLDLHTRAKDRFLRAFQDIILKPRDLNYVVQFTGPTGTNAVEAALKLARKVTNRKNVISFTNGFHGVTLGALALTGNQHFRNASGQSLQDVTIMPFDNYHGEDVDTISILKRMLDDPSSGIDKPAAIIFETVQGEGGLNVAGITWMQKLQALCNEREILLIVDDIQAGCGRTGSFFSFEEAGIKPDMVTLSKSLSGYGSPMAVVLIKPSLDQWKPAEHNGTFRGNNHAFVTATTALETYWRRPDFEQSLVAKSEHLAKRLQAMVDLVPAKLSMICGKGMMRGIRCKDPEYAAKVTGEAYEKGLIIERAGSFDEVIKCFMPLTIEINELDKGLDILEASLIECQGELRMAA